jgi:hypothetical protein
MRTRFPTRCSLLFVLCRVSCMGNQYMNVQWFKSSVVGGDSMNHNSSSFQIQFHVDGHKITRAPHQKCVT